MQTQWLELGWFKNNTESVWNDSAFILFAAPFGLVVKDMSRLNRGKKREQMNGEVIEKWKETQINVRKRQLSSKRKKEKRKPIQRART